jgi:hypothetical protein
MLLGRPSRGAVVAASGVTAVVWLACAAVMTLPLVLPTAGFALWMWWGWSGLDAMVWMLLVGLGSLAGIVTIFVIGLLVLHGIHRIAQWRGPGKIDSIASPSLVAQPSRN